MTKEYLHRATVGREADVRTVSRTVSEQLNSLDDRGVIAGYWLAFVKSEEEAEEKFIPDEARALTGGQFPFLYLRVNYLENHPENASIEALVSAAGFEYVP